MEYINFQLNNNLSYIDKFISFKYVIIENHILLLLLLIIVCNIIIINYIINIIIRVIIHIKNKLVNIIFSNENKTKSKLGTSKSPEIKIPKLPKLEDFEKKKEKNLIPDNRPTLWGIKVGSKPILPPAPGKKLEPPRNIRIHIPGLILFNSVKNGLGTVRNFFFPDDDKKTIKDRLKSFAINNISLVLLVGIVGTLYIYYYWIVGEHYPIIRGDPNWRPKIPKDWRIKLLESYHRPKWGVFQTQKTDPTWYYGPDRPPILVLDRKVWWAVIIDYTGYFPDYALEYKRRDLYNFSKYNRYFYNRYRFSFFGDLAADRKKRAPCGKRESTLLFKEFLVRRDEGEPVRIEAWKKVKHMFHEYKQIMRKRRKKPEQ